MTDKPKTDSISSWSQLVRVADVLDVGSARQRTYVFRGQPSAVWRLTPTLHRAATNDGRSDLPSPTKLLELERYLTARFKAEAPSYLSGASLSTTQADFDWWTVMRHHGAPTRLLDWTASIYVAAYFAASEYPDQDGALYLLHSGILKSTMQLVHGERAEFTAISLDSDCRQLEAAPCAFILDREVALTDRMIAQQGCYMLSHGVQTDFESALSSTVSVHGPKNNVSFRRIILKASAKSEIMRRLRAFNITASSLLPGLDGIGRALSDAARFN